MSRLKPDKPQHESSKVNGFIGHALRLKFKRTPSKQPKTHRKDNKQSSTLQIHKNIDFSPLNPEEKKINFYNKRAQIFNASDDSTLFPPKTLNPTATNLGQG